MLILLLWVAVVMFIPHASIAWCLHPILKRLAPSQQFNYFLCVLLAKKGEPLCLCCVSFISASLIILRNSRWRHWFCLRRLTNWGQWVFCMLLSQQWIIEQKTFVCQILSPEFFYVLHLCVLRWGRRVYTLSDSISNSKPDRLATQFIV